MSTVQLSALFVEQHCDLNWTELLWGFEHGWISAAGLIDVAVQRLASNRAARSEEVLLAGLDSTHAEQAVQLVRDLGEGEVPRFTPQRWLYLVLRWGYENRRELADPFGFVEQIYADFDYPEEIARFVRYMPASPDYDPASHTRQENEARLERLWNEFVVSGSHRCRPST